MSNLSLTQSPFDSIRRTDEYGNEFWYARELMPLLQYKMWQKFNNVIETAIENLETVVSSTSEHFLPVEIKSQGRPKLDYKLSRLSCYHVALCCDSRGNDAVKMAKHYFAVKTREAEVKIPQLSEDIQRLQLELELEKQRSETQALRIKANESDQALIGFKVGLKVTDPITYQIVVEGKELKDAIPLLPASRIEVRSPESEEGMSVTQLMGELGCFERTKSGNFKQKDRDKVKALLLELGIDLNTGRGASKVENMTTRYAVPLDKVIDAKSRILEVFKLIQPNLYEEAMKRQTGLNKL